jgi:hypothetical protein
MFSVDYDRFLLWLLPTFKRGKVTFSWLRSLCTPVSLLYTAFLIKRDLDLYNLQHDSRVFSLRAMLNDRFDLNQRRITISDGFSYDRIYIFQPEENKPVYLNTIPLYNEGDYGDSGVDFIVSVPEAIVLSVQDLISMDAQIRYYKLASKRFLIYRT